MYKGATTKVVVPAQAGTHTPCHFVLALGQMPSATKTPGVMGPRLREDDDGVWEWSRRT
jgi:hypothetical protein